MKVSNILPSFQHITLVNEERQKNVGERNGEKTLPYNGIRFQSYLDPWPEKVNVRVGN